MNKFRSINELNRHLVECRLCPRLVQFRESVKSKPKFATQSYWRRPVLGFGDLKAWLLITGLAPAAHGGNRTGRIFTGDATSRFLMNALYKTGFANQPISESFDDGLILKDCYLTAMVKCVPPKDRPTAKELITCCSNYYQNELALLNNVTHILALGRVAFLGIIQAMRAKNIFRKDMLFGFGQRYEIENFPIVYASYHPSPQNTNTGKLTEEMFVGLLEKIKSEC